MGKVVPLSAARKRGAYRASASATVNQEAGARSANVCRRALRAMKNVALALLRALWIGSVEVLLSVLLALARPARVVLKLGIMALVVVLILEAINHWRDKQLSLIAGGVTLGLIVILGFYDNLINWLMVRRSNR